MPRQVLIVFTLLLTLCTVVSAQHESRIFNKLPLASQNSDSAQLSAEQESGDDIFWLVVPEPGPGAPSVSLSDKEDCQNWTRQLRLDLKPQTRTHIVETAVQYFLGTERALTF